jgi:hypothetical protein
MNRKYGIAAGLAVGVVFVAVGIEVSGRLGGKSGTGLAVGTGASGGCADAPMVVAPELSEEEKPKVALTIAEKIVRTDKPKDLKIPVVPNRYIIHFKEETAKNIQLDRGSFRTGLNRLDSGLQGVTPTGRFSDVCGHCDVASKGKRPKRVWEVESDKSLEALEDALYEDKEIELIEPVVQYSALGAPNDPYYPFQWHMSALGMSSLHGNHDAEGVVIAVIDSGVSVGDDAPSHLLEGYDFVDDDNDASDSDYDTSEYGSHGTHVAGTIAQATNNGVGVVGLAPGAKILPIRALGFDAAAGGVVGSSLDIGNAITWAVDNGAQVINLSLGSSANSYLIEQACDYAAENNVVVIAASGNDGYTNFISYPAALESVVSVSATDLNHNVAYYSNHGEGITISAPGGDVTVDQDGDGLVDGVIQETHTPSGWGYYLYQGTSMASPHVAAVAGLLIGNGLTDRADVIDAMTQTADDLGDAGYDNVYGHGLVNPVAALAWQPEEAEAPVGDPEPEAPEEEPEPEAPEEEPEPEAPEEDPELEAPEEDPEDEVAAELEISRVVTRRRGRHRFILRFMTNEPGNVSIEASNGWTLERPEYRLRHGAVLMGRPGEEVVYTITSTSEAGSTGTTEVTVQF